jgi:hypothetical protein
MRWRTDRRVNGRNAWGVFYPDGEINKLKPKRSPVICYCCKKCGMIQGFIATQPEKLN